MTPWVRSEYANELAVLSAWLAALLPWNVTYTSEVFGGNFLFVRFPFFQVRYNFGVPVGQAVRIDTPVSAARFQQGSGVELPYQVWIVGAVILAIAILLSVGFYLREEQFEAFPVDPVRLMGVIIGLGALTLAVSTYYLQIRGIPGLTVPVGLLLIGMLAGLLLTVERADPATPESETDADTEGV